MASTDPNFTPYTITRPDQRLLHYYLLVSALTGPFFPFVFVPLFLKYSTLRYKFDEEGISMSWGLLFRKEILLTYRRIQDIHLTRSIVQRWMGLATVAIQTASGAASAEMSIDGILQADALRDFLYQRMRGAKGLAAEPTEPAAEVAAIESSSEDAALVLLCEIRDALRALADQRGRLA